jgi:hypothetical protein
MLLGCTLTPAKMLKLRVPHFKCAFADAVKEKTSVLDLKHHDQNSF